MTFFAPLALCLLTQPDQALPRRGVLGLGFTAPAGGGLVAGPAAPGLTADRAGVKQRDVVRTINGKTMAPAQIGPWVREQPAGTEIVFDVVRDGKPLQLKAPLVERPRDPGTDTYTVTYSHIVSHGKRMRTIITTPKTPGKHPAMFFIQGYSPISYDFTLSTSKGTVQDLDGPLLHKIADNNFVTMRVEKPGVGDSEGGPFADIDYTTELDIYRQALKQLNGLPEVDASNVIIFGHSMGGAFGPMVANEIPVKGIAVYGTAAKTWHEYLMEITRNQNILAGATPEEVDDDVRVTSRVYALAFHEGMSAEQIKKAHPELSTTVDALFPRGMMNDKTLEFWRQLGQLNFARYWAKCNARVLAIHGATDFVSYEDDHKLIADVVNRVHPGWGRFASIPNSDHLFHDWKTEKESQSNFGKGKYSSAVVDLLLEWMKETVAQKG